MPKAKKKSVVYRIAYYDETGKRRGKTFSAPTMREARFKAAEWETNRPVKPGPSMTVRAAVEAYIECKAAVLSPSTVRGYKSNLRSQIETIGDMDIRALDDTALQNWVNSMVAAKLSPKTVRNCYTLLASSIKAQEVDIGSRVVLPQPIKYIGYTPSDEDVLHLIDYAKGKKSKDLYIAILLAAFGPLRRSEICALTGSDINGNKVRITKAMVKDDNGTWLIKTTKTTESARVIDFPDFVISEISGIKGRLIQCDPDDLHDRFRRAIKYSKSPVFRFHDLRHYGASIMHALGVPDIYIMQRGGWATDHVMRRVYITSMDAEKKRQTDIINNHFSDLCVVKTVANGSESS